MTHEIQLRHFGESEFRHFDFMDPEFLYFIDECRERVGFRWFLTSDARTPIENARAGGSEFSLHLCEPARRVWARAIDFGIASFAHRPWQDWAKLARAVYQVRDDMLLPFGVQLELVWSIRDKHIHLGLFRDERPDELIVAAD